MNKIYADVTEDDLVDLPNFQWVVLASEAEEREAALREELVKAEQRASDMEELLREVTDKCNVGFNMRERLLAALK